MASVVWWQLSDIHWPAKPSGEHLDFIRHLIDELGGSTLKEHGVPAFVAVTGDIALSGASQEYSSVAESVFDPLKQALAPHGVVPILAVPGNHDLNRRDADNLAVDKIVSLRSPADVDQFLANKRQAQLYTIPFADYSAFVAANLSPNISDPLAWSTRLDIGSARISVTGLNSAWSSYYWARSASESDERRLLIGQQQLLSEPDDPAADIRILLTHHPLDWLNRETCSRVEQRIRQSYDVLLFGHVHTPRDLSLSVAPNGRCCLVPSPLLYHSQYEDSVEFARGYAVCSLDLDSMTLRTFYYRYSDAFGPKFVPYTDLYGPGKKHFTVILRAAEIDTLSGATLDGFETPEVVLNNLHSSRATNLRQAIPDYDEVSAPRRHSMEAYWNILRGVDFSGTPLFSPPALDASVLALVLGELVIARADNGLVDRTGTAAHLAHDLRRLVDVSPDLAHADHAALSELLDRVSLVNHNALTNFRGDSADHASVAFSVMWGAAQIALLLDAPWLIPDYLSGSMTVSGNAAGSNIMSILADSGSDNIKINIRTSTRAEFHAAAEAKHLIEQYFLYVEDMWRRLSLIPPAVRFELGLPQWRHRGLESHVMQVDPKPITRLLMGKALYGDRQHVWLRELIQNSFDATESRRMASNDDSYIPEVRVIWNDSHLIAVTDNGNGMSHQHILNYLATLGRSGWRTADVQGRDFDAKSFFGRFGIGFASVFGVASRVTVNTRTAGSRTVDGIRVSFSAPDRPFFLEPAPCPEGTEIRIELVDAVSLAGLQAALAELFVYLPPELRVEPSMDMPTSLEDWSLLSSFPKAPARCKRLANR
jgi:predicted phosphodiesterase